MLTHLCRAIFIEALFQPAGSQEILGAIQRALTDIQQVSTIGLQHLANLHCIRPRQAILKIFFGVIADADGIVPANHFTHGMQGLYRHTQTVFQRASVFIRSLVGMWREELRKQIAMSGVNLNTVETGFLSSSGRLRKLSLNLKNFFFIQRLRLASPQGIRLLGRSHRLETTFCLIGGSAGMMQLNTNFCAVFMNGICQAPQVWDKAVVPNTDLHGCCAARGGNGRVFNHDKANPALCPGLEIVDHPVRNTVGLHLSEQAAHGRHKQPVL